MDNATVVHAFKKGQDEQVQVSVGDYKNKKYVDVRVFFPNEEGTFFPTKKGLTLVVDLLPELVKGIQAAEKAIS